jgi:hypothetical protein
MLQPVVMHVMLTFKGMVIKQICSLTFSFLDRLSSSYAQTGEVLLVWETSVYRVKWRNVLYMQALVNTQMNLCIL